MLTTEDILVAYFDCRKTKRRSESALKFELDFETYCYDLAQEINNRTYEIGYSNAFFVLYPKKREVFAADFRDRVIHHWLTIRLEPLFENYFIEDTYNCRKGKGTFYGVLRLANKVKDISNNYTKDCWVSRFDMQGFFMSIHKPTLWKMLREFIIERYKGNDIADVLWIAEKIVLHCPEKKCRKKSSPHLWEGFPAEKSLFTCGEDFGLPIGNLTSQMFANFYLTEFDKMMVMIFGEGYGRYVDDFFIICTNKNHILYAIPKFGEWLQDNLRIRLHPDKMYIQHYTKGIKFTGSVVKPHRIYTANRTISKFIRLLDFIREHPHRYTVEEQLCRINSYLGFLRHTASYSIRRKTMMSIGKEWWGEAYVKGHFQTAVAKSSKKHNYKMIHLIKEKKEL